MASCPLHRSSVSPRAYIDTLHLVKGGKEIKGTNAQGQEITATRLPYLPKK